jgi:23S rRNA pseudouridine1911/1915/1917 synthase
MNNVQVVHRGRPLKFAAVLQQLTGLDDDQIALLIAMGGAYLGKYRCKDGERKVGEGQVVSAWYRLPLVMEPVTFDSAWVVRNGGDYLVAAKPVGLPTQGRRDADYLAFYEILRTNLDGYLGLHHRLDQDTSGLMLFSRRRDLNRDFAKLFKDRRIVKKYLAVTGGAWPFAESSHCLDEPVGRDQRRFAVRRDGKPAQTELRLLHQHQGLNLIEARPLTGRTHQIRVHLSHVGMPLLGDHFYGGGGPAGFLLHCHTLAWPQTGKLPAGDYRLAPPQAWFARLPEAFHVALKDAFS